jgi:hypothetical protein
MIWARKQIGTSTTTRHSRAADPEERKWTTPNRLICSQFCTLGLLEVYGASKVLNVLGEYAYLITPETLHLSPLFVGRMVKKVDAKLKQEWRGISRMYRRTVRCKREITTLDRQ